jgi:dethiobiotin synthetase
MKGLFITGTDTGVGKTRFTTGLISFLRAGGINAVGMKPIECGGSEDGEKILVASGGEAHGWVRSAISPVIFPEPLAPAAVSMDQEIDFDQIRCTYDTLAARSDFVVVEGAGGWLVPLDRDRTMADLAVLLDLPVLVVAANRIGVLNHTLLTVQAIQAVGLVCHGIYLNTFEDTVDLSTESNARVMNELLPDLPVFGMDFGGIVEFP